MTTLAGLDPEQGGKVFGIIVFAGAVVVYVAGRIMKGSKARKADHRTRPQGD